MQQKEKCASSDRTFQSGKQIAAFAILFSVMLYCFWHKKLVQKTDAEETLYQKYTKAGKTGTLFLPACKKGETNGTDQNKVFYG
ncbi:MAG: hypothetical protein LUH14_00710 [Clostridiaceae bacterium]|nr:hypothetical protein [Clostridiaceae bacterium]